MRGVVAIVGRPNVGKSSLFNRIIGERMSITDDASGVTRDRIYGRTSWLNQEFSVIDTGGIILKDEPFSKEIRAQAELAIDEADVIILVVDCRVGITDEDVEEAIKILNMPYIAPESIRFRDLLRVYGDCSIMVRTNYPKNLHYDMSNDEYEQDMLYGYCEWHDGELISDDGDNYYLDWVISKYEVVPLSGDLIIWLDVEWSGDNEVN